MMPAGTIPNDAALARRRASLLDALAQWNDARLTRRALRRLSPHELADLGLEDPETLFRR